MQSSELSKLSSNRTCLITVLAAVVLPVFSTPVFLMAGEAWEEAISLKMLVGPAVVIIVEGEAVGAEIEIVVLVRGGIVAEPVEMGGRGGGGGITESDRGGDDLEMAEP